VSSTEELNYSTALDWFGLRFVPDSWTLAIADGASAAQKDHLRALLVQ
jgi:hypothetical protein